MIDNDIYDRVPTTWWDEDGFMALLRTSVNPPRVAYFHKVLVERLGLDPRGLRVLDVGCGGGLLSEAFAASGCDVTGVDRSAPSLAAARTHAERSGLSIRYLDGSAESLPFDARAFDVVCCCDVLEHVDSPDIVLGEIARVLKPGGVFLFDTINRTLRSKLVAIKLAQDWRPTRLIPRDVHVWEKFIRPGELANLMERHGLANPGIRRTVATDQSGARDRRTAAAQTRRMRFDELGEKLRLRESRDLSISYMGYALRAQDQNGSS
jgi:2-polyprenyl-6-hydroxyphenyl methylase/3-demethylubiquinone-9 3-methyltransferase